MKFFCIPLFTCKTGIVETLDYSQLRLEEVPKEILKSRKYVEELLLNVNGIEELPTVIKKKFLFNIFFRIFFVVQSFEN